MDQAIASRLLRNYAAGSVRMKLFAHHLVVFTILLSMLACVCSCEAPKGAPNNSGGIFAKKSAAGATRLQGVNFSDPVQPVAHDEPVSIAAAKNEETSFALQVSDLPTPTNKKLLT